MKAAGDLAGSMWELVAEGAVRDGDGVIDGGRGRSKGSAGLEAHIIQERRLGQVPFDDLGRVMETLPPANKVQLVESVGSQGCVRQAADVFAVQVTIDPADLPAGSWLDDTHPTL